MHGTLLTRFLRAKHRVYGPYRAAVCMCFNSGNGLVKGGVPARGQPTRGGAVQFGCLRQTRNCAEDAEMFSVNFCS